MYQKSLSGKNCLVTGASGGIGKEIAKLLVENNCNIILTGKTKDKLEKLNDTLKLINQNNVKIDFFPADISKIEDIKKLISFVNNLFPSIDILINCAGVFPISSLQNASLEDFENCFNLNIKAPFILSKEFTKNMMEKQWGRIINIGSSSSYDGFKDTSIYCASKHALLGLSRSMFDELKEFNVRTFCISPGSVKTDMAKVLTKQDFSTFIDPKEVAEMIMFVISFDNEMIPEEIRLNRLTKK
jgi:3-oxoacyl-[acyl-carrier protein] reductase